MSRLKRKSWPPRRVVRIALPSLMVVLVGVIGTLTDAGAGGSRGMLDLPPEKRPPAVPGRGELGAVPKGDPAAERPADEPEPEWPAGVSDDGEAPFPATEFVGTNSWHRVVNGQHVVVYAGSLGEDPNQGVLFVMTISLDLKSVSGERYLAPTKSGALQIMSEENLNLTLDTTRGKRYTFDVRARRYR